MSPVATDSIARAVITDVIASAAPLTDFPSRLARPAITNPIAAIAVVIAIIGPIVPFPACGTFEISISAPNIIDILVIALIARFNPDESIRDSNTITNAIALMATDIRSIIAPALIASLPAK